MRNVEITVVLMVVMMVMVMLVGTASAIFNDYIWKIGDFKQPGRRFDTYPHDDPTVIEYTIGDDLSKFPSGLGTDIGSQRSVIKIHFNADLSEETKLVIKWSPGGSNAFEQFRVDIDEKTVGHSQYLRGSNPPRWKSENFIIPTTPGNTHVITLTHLKGDGLNLGAIGLFKSKKNLSSILAIFCIAYGIILVGYFILKLNLKAQRKKQLK